MQRTITVIGGGAAGALAALVARRVGAAVTLVRRAPGATAVSSGAFDFAAESDHEGAPLPVVASARALARRLPHHPYARLGDALGDALGQAAGLLGEELSALGVRGVPPGGVWRNLWLATPLGTTRRTALAQGAIARGDLAMLPPGARLGVVGVPALAEFDAQVVAAGLAREGFSAVALRVDQPLPSQATVFDLARSLDAPAGREPFVLRVLAAARAAGVAHVLLPVAGLPDPERVCDALVEGGLASAAELVGMPPSVPGLRLDRALEARLRGAGVRTLAADVAGARVAAGRVRALMLGNAGEIESDAFILATGRFVGGGIARGDVGVPGPFRETVFGLPVRVAGEDAGEKWLGDLLDRVPARAALRAGVDVDADLRPLGEDGRPAFENLFAAGAVLGGYDPADDAAGLGVAAVTALVAGRGAARA